MQSVHSQRRKVCVSVPNLCTYMYNTHKPQTRCIETDMLL